MVGAPGAADGATTERVAARLPRTLTAPVARLGAATLPQARRALPPARGGFEGRHGCAATSPITAVPRNPIAAARIFVTSRLVVRSPWPIVSPVTKA